MNILAAGLIVFFAVHLFSSDRRLRDDLIGRIGEKPYKAAFALLSLLGLVLAGWGKGHAPFESLWNPPAWGRTFALVLMPIAFILLAASQMPTNLKRFTAHPMLWGIVLWSSLHLLANGDRASILLFGSFFVYSIYAMISQTLRGVRPAGRPVPITRDVMVVMAGLVASVIIVFAHGYLFGVSLKG
jgi:uncharacterized membrane protein